MLVAALAKGLAQGRPDKADGAGLVNRDLARVGPSKGDDGDPGPGQASAFSSAPARVSLGGAGAAPRAQGAQVPPPEC